MPRRHTVLFPDTMGEALRLLSAGGSPLAGGTWVMRAPVRGEALGTDWVACSAVPELRAIAVGDDAVSIGAAATHASVASALDGVPGCTALVQAANGAANPAIRDVATIGGNLCTAAFAAADLAPALLCLGAEVELARAEGSERLALGDFLDRRAALGPGWLLSRVLVPRSDRASAHARLPLRKAGDYPVAIVSLSLERRPDGTVGDPRVAVGSVEAAARRWTALEQAMEGEVLDAAAAADAARALSGEFKGRDGIEAPGWYRVQVLPSLVRSAMSQILSLA